MLQESSGGPVLLYVNIGLSAAVIFTAGMTLRQVQINTTRIKILEEKANHLSSLERLADLISVQEKEIDRLRTRVDRTLDGRTP